MNFTVFDTTVKERIFFTTAGDLDEVPEEPGVYAWFLPMRGDTASNLETYLKSMAENMAEAVQVSAVSGETMQRRFQLERNPPTFQLSEPAIRKVSTSITSSQLQSLATSVLVLSFLSEPIYVGMTEANKGLKSRLRQHLLSVHSFDDDTNWRGSFRTRVAKLLSKPDYLRRCLIAYMPISKDVFGEDFPRLIEHILIRTIRPAQSVRG